MQFLTSFLLIVAKEDLDREPTITADLESILEVRKCLHLFICQLPSIKLEVGLDPALRHRFGNDRGSSLQTPLEHELLWCLALLLCHVEQGLVFVQRTIG